MILVDYWPIIICTFIGQLFAGVLSVYIKHLLDFRLRQKFITHYSSIEAGKGKGMKPPSGLKKPVPPPPPPEIECQGCSDFRKKYNKPTDCCACCHGRGTIPRPPPPPKLDPEDLYDFNKGRKK